MAVYLCLLALKTNPNILFEVAPDKLSSGLPVETSHKAGPCVMFPQATWKPLSAAL